MSRALLPTLEEFLVAIQDYDNVVCLSGSNGRSSLVPVTTVLQYYYYYGVLHTGEISRRETRTLRGGSGGGEPPLPVTHGVSHTLDVFLVPPFGSFDTYVFFVFLTPFGSFDNGFFGRKRALFINATASIPFAPVA